MLGGNKEGKVGKPKPRHKTSARSCCTVVCVCIMHRSAAYWYIVNRDTHLCISYHTCTVSHTHKPECQVVSLGLEDKISEFTCGVLQPLKCNKLKMGLWNPVAIWQNHARCYFSFSGLIAWNLAVSITHSSIFIEIYLKYILIVSHNISCFCFISLYNPAGKAISGSFEMPLLQLQVSDLLFLPPLQTFILGVKDIVIILLPVLDRDFIGMCLAL